MPFPNMKNKYMKKPLYTPEEFLRYQKKIDKYLKFDPPEGIILCYSRSLFDYIPKNHKVKKFDAFYGDFYLLEETENRVGVFGRFGIGAPIVATLIEELSAFGVKKFLSIGEAGSLQKNLKIGSIVVCDRAIRDEGTSYHYLKPSKYAYASKSMIKRIEETLKKLKLKYVVGTSWTTDAPYRETVAEVVKYRKEGVLTVEMEASAVFAVAKYRNIEAGAIFTISDYLTELEWKPKFHLSKKYLEKLFQVAKEVLVIS